MPMNQGDEEVREVTAIAARLRMSEGGGDDTSIGPYPRRCRINEAYSILVAFERRIA